MTECVQNVLVFVLNLTGYVLNMSVSVLSYYCKCPKHDWIYPKYYGTCTIYKLIYNRYDQIWSKIMYY